MDIAAAEGTGKVRGRIHTTDSRVALHPDPPVE
jgi:hypothetical protein